MTITRSQFQEVTDQVIKVGDFISCQYKYGVTNGLVEKVLKTTVVITEYNKFYDEYAATDRVITITKKRIFSVCSL